MKILPVKNLLVLPALALSLNATALYAGEPDAHASADVAPTFYIGQSSFPGNDSIEITSVERSPDKLTVKGHYNLVSADHARLALFITTDTPIAVPTTHEQLLKISKGSGDFNLTHLDPVPGLPHVTMYSIPGGQPFAGIYFGSKDDAARGKNMDLSYYADANTAASSASTSLSGPNQALLAYLGNPVEPPADLDVHYTVEGLTTCVEQAAHDAGITLKKLTLDDSEFPYLVGVVCSGSDYPKLKNQFKKLKDYKYNGSIGNDVNSDGSDTCNVFSLVPLRVYPPAAGQRIYHRLWLRQQVFFDSLNQH